MPIYEYKCSKCSAVFEALVRGNEKPVCPECGSKRLKKLVSVFGVGTARKPRAKSCACVSGAHHGCCGHCHCGHSH